MPIPDTNSTITCKIKFSGTNVLEGVKESVVCGCVSLPVPMVLTSLPRCSSNKVTVEIETQSPGGNIDKDIRDMDTQNNEFG